MDRYSDWIDINNIDIRKNTIVDGFVIINVIDTMIVI